MINPITLVTFDGFEKEFWSNYRNYNSAGFKMSQEQVFDELNSLYSDYFGEPRFPSFDAFRKRRDRHRK